MAPKANTNWLWNKSKVYVNEAKSDDEQCLLSDERKSKDELDALRTSYRRLKTILIGAFFVLTTICLALLISNLTDWRLASDQPRKASPIPPISSTSITFALDRRFAGPSSIENDQAWNALIPRGDGFIRLQDFGAYGLPPGKPTPSRDFIYDISLFHQIHCLMAIRNHLYLLEGSIGRNNSGEIHKYLLDPQEGHIHHCFDYLRQALMCAGDMTVEWPREEDDGSRFAFDGWGVTHQCKSWDAIIDFMEQNDA